MHHLSSLSLRYLLTTGPPTAKESQAPSAPAGKIRPSAFSPVGSGFRFSRGWETADWEAASVLCVSSSLLCVRAILLCVSGEVGGLGRNVEKRDGATLFRMLVRIWLEAVAGSRQASFADKGQEKFFCREKQDEERLAPDNVALWESDAKATELAMADGGCCQLCDWVLNAQCMRDCSSEQVGPLESTSFPTSTL